MNKTTDNYDQADKHNETSLTGVIERVLFSNTQSGYTVCTVKNDHSPEKITVCGTLPSIHEGNTINATGQWTEHPKFGRQFLITSYSIALPHSTAGIEKYLASGLIKGIGPLYAQRLVNFFGSKTLDIIDKEPEQLCRVPGIGKKRQQDIAAAWADQKQVAHIMVFLQEKEISTTYAVKIYKAYKHRAIELMLENPYRIAEDIWGIGFAIADAIAQKLSIAPHSVKRCRAAIVHVLSQKTQNGHVYVGLDDLKKQTYELLGFKNEEYYIPIKHALHDLYNEEKIKLISKDSDHLITTTSHYKTEKGIAEHIDKLMKAQSLINFTENEIYQKLRIDEQSNNFLHELQQKGVMSAFSSRITIITGGPGTGKTTLVKTILHLCDHFKITYKLAAPTGRAAKRLTQTTQKPAVTLHRLLEFDPSIMQFTKNAHNAVECSLLIVDESSMIDIFLMHSLLKAIACGTHIVFIGDIDQLPSVGSGNVLCDMIESNIIPVVRLTHIFRQAHESLIVTNAHRINNGEFFITYDEKKPYAQDFYFIKEDNPDAIESHFKYIITSVLPQKHIATHNTVVLLPMNRGSVGTIRVNQMLQSFLNPHAKETVMHGSYNFKVGDRVMQIKNNYDKNIFNGDVGTISSIDQTDQTISVQFDFLVEYDFRDLDELVLAYAISIHKSQGSEYDAVIIPFFMQHFTLLQRKLLYTAVTRAKKTCILLGQTKAFWSAISNHTTQKRITLLKDFLTTDLSAR